jgi:divalent metal cation (Fe/Co/Zn/Cd) transporter
MPHVRVTLHTPHGIRVALIPVSGGVLVTAFVQSR